MVGGPVLKKMPGLNILLQSLLAVPVTRIDNQRDRQRAKIICAGFLASSIAYARDLARIDKFILSLYPDTFLFSPQSTEVHSPNLFGCRDGTLNQASSSSRNAASVPPHRQPVSRG